MIRMNHTAFPDFHITIEDVIAEKDRVVLRFNWSGTHKEKFMGIPPTGKHITVNTICIYRIEGGKVKELWAQVDLQGMMQQLGAVPTSGPGKK